MYTNFTSFHFIFNCFQFNFEMLSYQNFFIISSKSFFLFQAAFVHQSLYKSFAARDTVVVDNNVDNISNINKIVLKIPETRRQRMIVATQDSFITGEGSNPSPGYQKRESMIKEYQDSKASNSIISYQKSETNLDTQKFLDAKSSFISKHLSQTNKESVRPFAYAIKKRAVPQYPANNKTVYSKKEDYSFQSNEYNNQVRNMVVEASSTEDDSSSWESSWDSTLDSLDNPVDDVDNDKTIENESLTDDLQAFESFDNDTTTGMIALLIWL